MKAGAGLEHQGLGNLPAQNLLLSSLGWRLPMNRVVVATIFLGWLVFPAAAAGLDAAAINNAEFRSKLTAEEKIDATVVKAQVLLGPGSILARGN